MCSTRAFHLRLLLMCLALFALAACNTVNMWEELWHLQNGGRPLEGTLTITPSAGDIALGTTLTANYAGSEKVSYQWEFEEDAIFFNISGATGKTHTALITGNYRITVIAENRAPKTSDPVFVGEKALFELTGSVTIEPTENVGVGGTLTATYIGPEEVLFRWHMDGEPLGGESGGFMPGEPVEGGAVMNFAPAEPGLMHIEVRAEGYASKVSEQVRVLRAFSGTLAVSPPADERFTGVTLAASLDGDGVLYAEPSWRWYREGEDEPVSEYAAFTPSNAGTYTVVVSAEGYASKRLEVIVLPLDPLPGDLTLDVSAPGSAAAQFTANYSGSESVTYKWLKDGHGIAGADAQVYTPDPEGSPYTPDKAGSYSVEVRAAGYEPKVSAALPYPLAFEGVLSIDTDAPGDKNVELTAVYAPADGETIDPAHLTYQWYTGGEIIDGANAKTYIVPTPDGTYTARIRAVGYADTTSEGEGGSVTLPFTLSGSVSLTPMNAVVGGTLTAVFNSGSVKVQYQWFFSMPSEILSTSDYVSGEITANHTPSAKGWYGFSIRAIGYTGVGASVSVGLPPLPDTVSIAGNNWLGEELTAVIDELGGSGEISYSWNRADEPIPGANGSTYVVQDADAGQNITVTVSRDLNTGSATSVPFSILPNLTGTVTISGTARVGQELTANTDSLAGTGELSYRWLRGATEIPGATGAAYTVHSDDEGENIAVVVRRDGHYGIVTSGQVTISDKVHAEEPNITVQPQGASCTLGGTAPTLSVTASSPDGGEITYQWWRKGDDGDWTEISGATGAEYTPNVTAFGIITYRVLVTNTIDDNDDGGNKEATIQSGEAAVAVGAIVTFDKNAADANSPWANPHTMPAMPPAGTVGTLPTAPTRTGYTFDGWNTQEDGGGTEFTASTAVTESKTVYAKWTLNHYTVTFNSDGGSPNPSPVNDVSHWSTIPLPVTSPAKTGYTFGGWFTAANGGGTEFTANTAVTADITVYAKWALNHYTVTFNSDGGSPNPSPVNDVPHGSTIELPATPPAKTGWLFGGWYTAEDGVGEAFTAGTEVTANITVYAKWNAYTYTVTFDSAEGSAVTPKTVVSPATTIDALPAEPTRTGYTFGGWYTAADGGGEAFTAGTEVTADLTLHAKWNAYTYTVTFDSAEGSAVTPKTVVSPATTVGTLPTAPTRTGYTFDGWNTQQDGGGTEFTANTAVTANITVYAKWTLNHYTVTFNSDGGSPNPSPVNDVPHGSTIELPATPPAKTGWLFGGWYTAANGGGTEFTASTEVTADLTLHAKWNAYTYTITFDSAEGSAVTPKTVVSPATTVGTLPAEPTRTGWLFGGWYTAANGGGTEFTAGTQVTANITVYAKWTLNHYTVTYNSDGGAPNPSPVNDVPHGSTIELPATPPAKTGWLFGGWYTAEDGGGEAFTAGTEVTADLTLHAKWNAYTYTVTFDSAEGSAVTPKTVVSPATTIDALPAEPTRTGWLFGGWYTAADGGGTEFTAGTQVTANITVYAKWNTYTYTVTFDSAEGSAVTPKTVVSPATTIDALPAEPTRTGYTFGGWYTAANGGGEAFTANTAVTESKTVYAKWTGDLAAATVTVNGGPFIYKGSAWEPSVSVAHPGSPVLNTHYTVVYSGNINAGTASVKVEAVTGSGYSGNQSGNFAIEEKPITITGVTANSRAYSPGETSVTLAGGALQGVESGDAVAFTLDNGTMTDANAGSNKTVAANITLTGDDRGNYTLTPPAYITVTITKAAGAAVTAPAESAAAPPTHNTITVTAASLQTATSQEIEYAISTSNFSPESGWTGVLIFNGLNADTDHYVFARSKANGNYEAGTAVSITIKTALVPNGSAAAPFLIATFDDLNSISKTETGAAGDGRWTLEKHYKQVADIAASSADWVPIGNWDNTATGDTIPKANTIPFTGVYDGSGYVISGLQLTGKTGKIGGSHGLFGYINGAAAAVRNLGLVQVDSSGNGVSVGTNSAASVNMFIGGVAGVLSAGMIENCFVTGKFDNMGSSPHSGNAHGGIVGRAGNGAKISGCFAAVEISGHFAVGGIVGEVRSFQGGTAGAVIENCFVTGIVKGGSYTAGGIAGQFGPGASTLSKCYAAAGVTGGSTTLGIGGILGGRGETGGSITITSCAALSPFVRHTDGVTTAAATGRVVGISNTDGIAISNTYGRIGMVIGASGNGIDANLTVTVATAQTLEFWQTTLGWNFTSVWTMKSGLPILLGIPASVQNPELQEVP